MFKKFLIVMLAVAALTACRPETGPQTGEATYVVVREATIEAGDRVPAPTGKAILTVSGRITNTNVGDTLQFDMDALEGLGLIEYSVDDKQALGRIVTFQGVLLSQLLAVAGMTNDANTLYTVALNDYAVDIPVTDAQMYPVLLATSADGQRMPVEQYGPIRIVYPYSSYDMDVTIYDPRWIWQLASIDVR